MGIFSGGFSRGLLEGVATGANRTLTVALDKRQEEMSAARKYMQQRRIQQSEKYAKEGAEMESLMKGFSELTGGDLDKAAQLIKGAGNIEQANARLTLYRDEFAKNENFDINTAFKFAESKVGEGDPYVIGDYVESLITRPSSIDSPIKPRKFGLGLASKILGEDDASQVTMPEAFGRRIDVGTAQAVAGATSVGEEYSLKQEQDRLALATSKIGLLAKQKEIANLGGLTNTEGRTYWKDSVSEAVKLAALPINAAGEFDLSSAPEKLNEARVAYSDALKDTVRYFTDTGTINTNSGKNQLKSFARNPFIDIVRDKNGSAYTPLTNKGEFDYKNMKLGNLYGVGTPTGEVAKYLFAGFDDENEPLMFQLQ
jgi:soluble cytochrome b562